MTLKEIITSDQAGFYELIVSIITLIIVTLGLLSIRFQKKEIRFLTIQKCVTDHRDILRNQQKYCIENKEKNEHLILIRDHLGLITEELFYMKEGYLPKDLSLNWLRHMIEFVPITKGTYILNKPKIKSSKEISYFLNCTDKQAIGNRNKNNLREDNYNIYTELVSDKKSFCQINNVFELHNHQIKKLEFDDKNNIKYNDKNVKKLVHFIWNNNKKKRHTKIKRSIQYKAHCTGLNTFLN